MFSLQSSLMFHPLWVNPYTKNKSTPTPPLMIRFILAPVPFYLYPEGLPQSRFPVCFPEKIYEHLIPCFLPVFYIYKKIFFVKQTLIGDRTQAIYNIQNTKIQEIGYIYYKKFHIYVTGIVIYIRNCTILQELHHIPGIALYGTKFQELHYITGIVRYYRNCNKCQEVHYITGTALYFPRVHYIPWISLYSRICTLFQEVHYIPGNALYTRYCTIFQEFHFIPGIALYSGSELYSSAWTIFQKCIIVLECFSTCN